MRRWFACLAMLACLAGPPALAQRDQPTAAQVQALLADIGAWALEYGAVLNAAAETDGTAAFSAILDRFDAGEISTDRAVAELGTWREQAVAGLQQVRDRAARLRRPPSFAIGGPEGRGIDRALNAAYDNVIPYLDRVAQLDEATYAMGVAAVRDPEKVLEVRQRVFFQSSVEALRGEMMLLDVMASALPRDHPNVALLRAARRFYAAFNLMPAHEIAVLDNAEPGQAALAGSLREAAASVREEAAQCLVLTERMRTQLRLQQPRGGEALASIVLRSLDTYPPAARAFQRLADTLDVAASAIEGGQSPAEAWRAASEAAVLLLEEISRIEEERARILMGQANRL